MTLLKILLLFTVTMFSWQPEKAGQVNYGLYGTVVSSETGKPLPDAYIYAVKGEEETLTDDKGEFKFISWQKLPITIHVDYSEKKARMVIADPRKKIMIKL